MARRRHNFVRSAPRTKMWIGAGIGPGAALAGSTTTLFASLSAAALLLRPFTVLRTRIELLFESDQQSASERPSGLFGQIVVSDSAAAAGAASIPSPLANPEADWFVYLGMTTSF